MSLCDMLFTYRKGKERKGTLLKCVIVLALEHQLGTL